MRAYSSKRVGGSFGSFGSLRRSRRKRSRSWRKRRTIWAGWVCSKGMGNPKPPFRLSASSPSWCYSHDILGCASGIMGHPSHSVDVQCLRKKRGVPGCETPRAEWKEKGSIPGSHPGMDLAARPDSELRRQLTRAVVPEGVLRSKTGVLARRLQRRAGIVCGCGRSRLQGWDGGGWGCAGRMGAVSRPDSRATFSRCLRM